MLVLAGKMFTTGRIIFSLVFIIAFVAVMVLSYKKDASNNKIHYKNGAIQVAIILVVLILLLLLTKIFLRD